MTILTTPGATRQELVSDLLVSKVPQVTVAFWIIKVLATTVGETAADYLNFDLGWGLRWTIVVAACLLAVALVAQLRTHRYSVAVYWTAVVLISVVGTLITDLLTDVVGVPLVASTAGFSVLLAALFVIWHRVECTLSIHSITTTRREGFYWAAILLTFALGTAAGDLLAEGVGLGYDLSAALFAAAIGGVAVARFVVRANAVACFWIAYVLTRPLGASLGDLTSQPVTHGGLGLGATATSAAFLVVILALVIGMSVRLAARRRALLETLPAVA